MSNIVIAGLTAVVAIGLIKIYSDKPQDSEGKTILNLRDRIVGGVVLLCAAVGIVFVKTGLYGVGSPLLLLSSIIVGVYVIYNRLQRGAKKRG